MIWSEAIKEYHLYLTIERGIASNSLEAYMRDLDRYQFFAEKILETTSPGEITLDDLRAFLNYLVEECFLSERSLARNISTIRSFHGFLLTDELVENDPSQLLELPRFGQKLPVVLSLPELEAIFQAVDMEKRADYATGLCLRYSILQVLGFLNWLIWSFQECILMRSF